LATDRLGTRLSDVVETLHGERIADPYRWLEDGEDADVRAWTERQNARTEAYLAAVPERPFIRKRLEQLLTIGELGTPQPAHGRYLYSARNGAENQPVLYVRDGVHGSDRAAVDPNAINPAGTTALDWWQPSDDGHFLAYGLSEGGSERSMLHVLDLGSLRELPDRIPDTRAADVAWLPDARGFYYTRYPAAGTVPEGEEQYHRAVYLHLLGSDPSDDTLIYQPREKEHWPSVSLSDDGRWLVVSVARTFDQTDLYLADRAGEGTLVPVVENLPALFECQIVRGRLYIRSNIEAPTYALYEADPSDPARARWRTLVAPRPEAVLEVVAVTSSTLTLAYLERATSRLVLTDLDGGNPRHLPLPGVGSVHGLGSEPDGTEIFYHFSSFVVPPSVYRVALPEGAQMLWRRVEADVDTSRFEVAQVTYPSRDGTPITMFLVHPRGLALDGQNPAFLTGYGGFNINMTPGFTRSLLMWLEQGGVLAVPNLRGGGEYGESWHQDGMLARKQNTFDDGIWAAEWLIAKGYTSSERLVVQGGSNGGLLTGALLTQRPELFRAVIIQVPLLDMLRYHHFLIARLWIPEYGSAEDPEQFRWLRAYSPYHHVRDGVKYPAVLLATAESDTRVDPLHARKMAARLQAATASDRPVLLRLESQAGHGAGKPLAKRLAELTDMWTFVFHELGVRP
jgi:prolyl oligopeptidase